MLNLQDYDYDFKSQSQLSQDSSFHGEGGQLRPSLDYSHPAYQLYWRWDEKQKGISISNSYISHPRSLCMQLSQNY